MSIAQRSATFAVFTTAASTKNIAAPGSSATSPSQPTQGGDGEIFAVVGGTPIDSGGAPAGFGVVAGPANASGNIYLTLLRRVADSLDPGRIVTTSQQSSAKNILGIAALSGADSRDPVSVVSPSPTVDTTAASTHTSPALTPASGWTGRTLLVIAWKDGATPSSGVTVSSGYTLLPDGNSATSARTGGATNQFGLAFAMSNADASTYTPGTFTTVDSSGNGVATTAVVYALTVAPSTANTWLRPRNDIASTGASVTPTLTNPGANPQSMALSDLDPASRLVLPQGATATFGFDAPAAGGFDLEIDQILVGATTEDLLVELMEGTTVRVTKHVTSAPTTLTTAVVTFSAAEAGTVTNRANLAVRLTATTAA